MQQPLQPSLGADVVRSPHLLIASNATHSVTVYWRDGAAVPFSQLPPKAEGAMRVATMSDTHGKASMFADMLPPKDEYDVLIHAGDFTSTGTHAQTQAFASFLENVSRKSIVIAGNHDVTFDGAYYADRGAARFHSRQPQIGDPRLFFSSSCIYLQDSGTLLIGAVIWGSPWQPAFCDWAFNEERKSKSLAAKWAAISDDTTVLITHGPPHGKKGGICRDGFDAGCELLADRVAALRPLVHVVGHIHECAGVYLFSSDPNSTIVINASSVDLSYRPTNPPIFFDLVKK